MKYIKEFETNVLKEDFKLTDNYETPNVYILSDMTLEFNRYHDYSQDYLTFVALEDCEFSFKFSGGSPSYGIYITTDMRENIAYSLDNGETWTEYVNPGNLTSTTTALTTPTIHKGKKVIWKGIGTNNYKGSPSSGQYGLHCWFSSTGRYNVEGNILSIAYGDNFKNQTSLSESNRIFNAIFSESTNLISAKNLILSVTTLGEYCYNYMFSGCSSLTTAPKLPATTLANYCYYGMFNNCTSLTTAPKLPATTLANACYYIMFNGCSSLNSITCLATNIPSGSTYHWLFNVAANGTFTKAASMSNWGTGADGIPEGWTIQNV